MCAVYQDKDVDLSLIRNCRVAIIGFGNQGHAQAQNLRDSGCTVRIGLRPDSPNWARAEDEGFIVHSIAEATAWADVISLLLPDQLHRSVFADSIEPALASGSMLLLAHGFSIHYGQLKPPHGIDVVMVAPIGPGAIMRRLFLAGSGIPALLATWRDGTGRARKLALSYAGALGCARIGVRETTFAEETETDLFGEQAVLCGGLAELASAGFETLVEAGYQPEIAYYECIHQLKLIVDLIYEEGIDGMRSAISDTALYGSLVSGPLVVDEHVRANLRRVLSSIKDGTFAHRWIDESEAGMPTVPRLRSERSDHVLEQTGEGIRASLRRPVQ